MDDAEVKDCIGKNSHAELQSYAASSISTFHLIDFELDSASIGSNGLDQFVRARLDFIAQIRSSDFGFDQSADEGLFTNQLQRAFIMTNHEYFNEFALVPNCTKTDFTPLGTDALAETGSDATLDEYKDKTVATFVGQLNPSVFPYSADFFDTNPVPYKRNLLTHRINTEIVPLFIEASKFGSNSTDFRSYNLQLTQYEPVDIMFNTLFTITYEGL